MALALMAGDPGAGDDSITLADAVARVDDAITYGRLASQSAPAGHPIFAAISNAQDVRDQLADMIPWFSATGPMITPAMSRTWGAMQGAIDGINAAAATIQSDPGQPLPATNWAGVLGAGPGVPWPLLAGGAALVALAAVVFRPARRRRRNPPGRHSARARVLAGRRRVRRPPRRFGSPERRRLELRRDLIRTQELPAFSMAELVRQHR